MTLHGRTALITGATVGTGGAIARLLAQRGATVALHAHGESLEAVATEIQADGGSAFVVAGDLRDWRATQRMVEETYGRTGRLDILVNCSTPLREHVLLSLPPEEWHDAFSSNVHGAFYAIQAAAKYMLLDRRGRIVNVTGVAGTHPARAQAHHAAAMGALHALTRSLAVELAPKQIAVNAVAPGVLAGEAEPADRLLDKVPLQRAGLPGELAELVAFLASDDASYITGEVLLLDGGLSGRR